MIRLVFSTKLPSEPWSDFHTKFGRQFHQIVVMNSTHVTVLLYSFVFFICTILRQ